VSTGADEMSVFQALSGGNIGQAPIAGLLVGTGGGGVGGPGVTTGILRRITRALAQRWRRHARTL
jgi:hypothetical protein